MCPSASPSPGSRCECGEEREGSGGAGLGQAERQALPAREVKGWGAESKGQGG